MEPNHYTSQEEADEAWTDLYVEEVVNELYDKKLIEKENGYEEVTLG